MSILLRAALILVSALVTVSVTGRIRKARMQIEDAVFWVLFSLLLVPVFVFGTRDLSVDSFVQPFPVAVRDLDKTFNWVTCET